jgi:hypothetical protein
MLTTPDHSDAVTSPPAAAPVGPHPKGFYQDCDSATGRAGTIYRAEDFNELIQNLRQVVMSDAAIAGTKGAATMLRDALRRLYVGNVTSVVATQTLTPDQAGLVIVDATAGNVVLTLPAAASLPGGAPTFQFTRIDTASANTVRIVPGGTDVIRSGIALLETGAPFILRSDRVNTWYALQVSYIIARATTLNVSPTGVAMPRDPLGGDAFDTLPRALAFLQRYDLQTAVTIQLAAGTYTLTTPISFGLAGAFGQPQNIIIQGAGVASTILQFNGCSGFQCFGTLNRINDLTIQGNQAASTTGLLLRLGTVTTGALKVRNFGLYGIALEFGAKLIAAGKLDVWDNLSDGIRLEQDSMLTATGIRIDANNNGGLGNIFVGTGSFLTADQLVFTTGVRGLYVAGGSVSARKISPSNITQKTSAVYVTDHGVIAATTASVAGDWVSFSAGSYDTFKAEYYGLMKALAAFDVNNRGMTSPAVNTVGNTQAYIQAT